MARKIVPKTSSLSAEYVVDSSDGEAELAVQPTRSKEPEATKKVKPSKWNEESVKSRKRKRPSPREKQRSPSPESEVDEASDEEEEGGGGMVAESAEDETPEPTRVKSVTKKKKSPPR
jgi:hypothetical protein